MFVNHLFYFCFFASSFFLIGTLSASQPKNEREMLASYEFSGPLYSLMRKYDPAIQLTDLDASFQAFPGEPIERLVAVSQRYGIPLTERTIDSTNSRRIPTPSLILIKENDGGRQIHSFLLAEGHTDSGLLIYEFRNDRKWNVIPYLALDSQFTGTILERKTGWFTSIEAGVFVAGLLFLVGSLICRLKLRLPNGTTGQLKDENVSRSK